PLRNSHFSLHLSAKELLICEQGDAIFSRLYRQIQLSPFVSTTHPQHFFLRLTYDPLNHPSATQTIALNQPWETEEVWLEAVWPKPLEHLSTPPNTNPTPLLRLSWLEVLLLLHTLQKTEAHVPSLQFLQPLSPDQTLPTQAPSFLHNPTPPNP
ncbi:MAG: hypothetical protein AAGJ35_04535, partial [Myxococcota bacterium]